MTLRSSITGNVIHSGPLFNPIKDLEIERTTEGFEELLQNIVEDRYSMVHLEEKIENIVGLLESISQILDSRYSNNRTSEWLFQGRA